MDRIERVNELIKREISVLIRQEIKDPRLAFVTILEVKVSRDLQHARVSYSVLGDDKQVEAITKTLDNARGFIRRELAKRVRIKQIPEIEFYHDKSLEYSERIDRTLQEINREQSDKENIEDI